MSHSTGITRTCYIPGATLDDRTIKIIKNGNHILQEFSLAGEKEQMTRAVLRHKLR